MVLEAIVVATILLALSFDFINGFHDSANAIATVVATRVLTPVKAVLMAGAFNFIGPFVFSLAVANAVGKGIIDPGAVTVGLIIAALLGAIVWDLLTWWVGLPTSSSHALTGGQVGAAIAAVGTGAVIAPTAGEIGIWFADGTLHLGIVWRYLAIGALGGLVVGVAFLPWSRLRLSKPLLGLFALLGTLALGYYSYTQSAYPGFELWREDSIEFLRAFFKPMLLNFVFAFAGALAGAFLWAATQQPMSWRNISRFPLPGAAGTLAVFTMMNPTALGGFTKVVVFMFVSPVLGFFMGFLVGAVSQWVWRNVHASTVHFTSRRLQLGSSAFYALTHGTNDAQKTMGIIGVLLFSVGAIGLKGDGTLDLPTWVIIASAAAMGLGTAFGGWRIVRTMAARITHLTPPQGFAAETGGGVVLVAMAEAGIPVSTTHAISSSIMGVGATRRLSAVRWGVGRQMFIAWILTIPAAAAVAYVSFLVLRYVFNVS